MIKTKAIILCSGRGTRAGFTLPKQFTYLNNYPVIYYIINTTLKCSFIEDVYVVILKEYKTIMENIFTEFFSDAEVKKIHVVYGDDTRQRSIQCANNYLRDQKIDDKDQIFVIDGVRPLVKEKLLEDMNNINKKENVVGCYTDCVSTILVKNDNFLHESLVRDKLAASHTPQIFKYGVFKKMYEQINTFDLDNETECLNLALKYCNEKAYLLKTKEDEVMKITYNKDIYIAEHILKTSVKKVVLITGGSRGIGKATARKLSCLDYNVIICARDKDNLIKTANELLVDYFVCDISDFVKVQSMFSYILEKYERLDILINNASISHEIKNIEDIDNKTIQDVLNINLFGTIYCTQEAIKVMKIQKKGTIITVGSSGIMNGRAGQSIYLASKNALKTVSECLSIEGKENNISSYFVVPRRANTAMRNSMYPHENKSNLLNENDVINNILFMVTEDLPKLSGNSFWIR